MLPGRLRGELTEFVGRRSELALVRQELGHARLVTLTGPGGIGKTRLALQAAAGARRAFADGVWLAELAGLRDPALLVPEVARSLGLSDRSGRWAVAALADYLHGKQVLLVLDGCEHLADGCAVLADALLRACPGLRIMATSRHVLGVAGEVTVPVPPMTVPGEADPDDPEELLRFEAVRLFTARAAAVLPGFALDAGSGPVVAAVCRALDGIPLAVELAVVRLRSLSLLQILSRLDSRFELLSGGGPAGQPHHRTLQAAMEWSYGLLTEAEQAMWRRVSVFAGPFDLDAAEGVCAGGEIAPESVLTASGTRGGIDEQAGKDRGDSGGELDQVASGGLLGGRARSGVPAAKKAQRRGEERHVAVAARRSRVDQGPGRAVTCPVAQHLGRDRCL
jgi:predicted ATPase